MLDTIEQLLERLKEMGIERFSLHIDIDEKQPDAQIVVVIGGLRIDHEGARFMGGRQIGHGDGDSLPDALWNLSDALDEYDVEVEGFTINQITEEEGV